MSKPTDVWDPFTEDADRKPKSRWLLKLMFSGLALGVGAVLILPYVWVVTPRLPRLVGDDAVAYVSLVPSFAALTGLPLLRQAYPELFQLKEVQDAKHQLEASLGVSFEEDVWPWLGPEIGVARYAPQARGGLRARPDHGLSLLGQGPDLLAVAVRDRAKAQAFLAKVLAVRRKHGEKWSPNPYKGEVLYSPRPGGPACGLVGDAMVLTSSQEELMAAIDRQASGRGCLAELPAYSAVMGPLTRQAVGFLYLDGDKAQGLVAAKETAFQLPGGSGRDALWRQPMAELDTVQAMGFALSLDSDGLTFDSAFKLDLTRFDEATRSRLAETRQAVDNGLFDAVPGEALAASTFVVPKVARESLAAWLEQARQENPELLKAEASWGIDLEEDLLSWFEGDMALALLRGDATGVLPWPVGGYVALRPVDRKAAEAGVERLTQAAERQIGLGPVAIAEERSDGVQWHVARGRLDQTVYGAWGFVGPALVIAGGPEAPAQVAAAQQRPLSAMPRFRAIADRLPRTHGGLAYADLTAWRAMVPPHVIDATWRRRLAPLTAFGAAGTPGIDDSGLMRATMVVQIEAPTPD